MALASNTRLGSYEVVALIGEGGMGEVYQAHDTKLGRDVAIKVLPEAFAHDAERLSRFQREAKMLASLNHPNIATIYGLEQSGSTSYLAMELVSGETLQDRVKRDGAVPIEEALTIAKQIAEALEAAHEKGIIHRDLKPANVKVTPEGKVKVLDFGLAKAFAGDASTEDIGNSPTLSQAATMQGVILGTAAYMSPEQARGKAVDKRTDIWAFGCVLYELLTGKQAFHGEDVTDILAVVVRAEPDWNCLPAITSPAIRNLLRRCLQKDAKKRLRDAGDARIEIEEALSGAAIPEVVAPTSAKQRLPFVLSAVTALLLVALAGLSFVHFLEVPSVVHTLRYQISLPGNAEFFMFQLSPDGRFLVYRRRTANNRLYVRALDSLEEREIPGTEGATHPFWSPDSAHIAFFAQGKLKQVALSGGPATNISDAPDGRGGTWGADGTIVFAPTVNGGLFRISPTTSGPSTPLRLPVADKDSLRFPAFLPDSAHFFYVYTHQGGPRAEDGGLYVGSLNGTPPVRILSDSSTARFVPSRGSSTSGHLLFRRDTTLMAQPFDAATLKPTGEAIPLADPVPDMGRIPDAAFTVSTNGILIYLSGGGASQERQIAWLDREGKLSKSLLKQKGIDSFALSPNSTQVVYSTGSQPARGDLWLYDMAHGTTQRFTFEPFDAHFPLWSPDGTTVVFCTYLGSELYRKATQTSAKEESLGIQGTNARATSWAGDGKLLVYSQTGDTTKDDLWLLPLEGDRKPKIFKQTPFNESDGEISPDGRWMVYNSDASGQYEIYIEPMPAGGAQRQISVGGGQSPAWRSDGRELYFLSDNKLMAVDIKPGPGLTFGTPHELFSGSNLITNPRQRAVFPSADGRQFLALLPAGDAPAASPITVVTNWQTELKK
jgi:serine/threonine protein kinase/Tol biopolymer transport system component